MKPILLYSVIICAALVITYYLLFSISSYESMGFFQRYATESILNSFDKYLEGKPPDERAVIDYDSLLQQLSLFQRLFLNNILSINPAELGFKGPYYSVGKPGNLIKIESVPLGSGRETGVQYLPAHVLVDYERMMMKMAQDIGRKLYIDSGYRSPGRQTYLFIYYLVKSSGFSLRENAKWIAMPGYSEHGHPVNTAIDFTTEEGINGFSEGQTAADFAASPEYKWLLENAQIFNFRLSYPEGNESGVAFEPWHWHWEK